MRVRPENRTEGVDEFLGNVAARDPWRFLHRTRFGVAGTNMPIGTELGWSASDGRDILLFAQSLPTVDQTGSVTPSAEDARPAENIGGPGSAIWQGILTGIAALTGLLGSSLLFLIVLLALIGGVVWALRRRS